MGATMSDGAVEFLDDSAARARAAAAEKPRVGVERFECEVLRSTFNEEKLTLDVVCYSGAEIDRVDFWTGDPWKLRLSLDNGAVDLGRFNNGGSVTRDHSRWSVDDVVGTIVKNSAKVDPKLGLVATVQLSRRADLEGFRQDVKDGIVNKLSVEARRIEAQTVEANKQAGEVRRVTWTKWECQAVSFVVVQADPAAVTLEDENDRSALRRGDSAMTEEERKAAEAKAAAEKKAADEALAAASRAEGARLEAERAKAVRAIVAKAKLAQSFADAWAGDPNITVEKAREMALDELGKQSASAPVTESGLRVGVEEGDKVKLAMQTALLHRARGSVVKLEHGANDFAGMTMLRMAEECILRAGGKVTRRSPDDILKLAHSTTDFPNILAGGVSKSLREQYKERTGSWEQWAKRGTLPDFKSTARNILSASPGLNETPEGGSIQTGVLTEGKETIQLKTYSVRLSLTRQAQINDDLDAFSKLPQSAAIAARRIESELVYHTNLNANPLMADGVAIFASGHGGNIITPVLALTALTTANTVMRNQKGLAGEELDLSPKFLIVPPELEVLAWQLCFAEIFAATTATANRFKGLLTPIVEGRLNNTAKSGSTTAWFLAASNDTIDTIEVAFLEGSDGPMTAENEDPDTLGVSVDVWHDVGAKALDYRGLVKSSGTV